MNVFTEAHLTPEPWTADGACLELPPDMWFADHGDNRTSEAAKRICNTQCNVREQCLEYALRTRQTVGIWGGCGPKTLYKLRRNTP